MKKRFLCICLVALLSLTCVMTAFADEASSFSSDWGELSWMKDTSPVTFTCYIDYDWYSVDTWGNDEISQEITARTGVSMDVIKASDNTQLGVLLASGDLTDIIFTDTNVQRFEDPDICAPWDELIPKYCPEFMDLIDPIERINNTVQDGHFYTLKTHYSNEEAWADPRNVPSPGSPSLGIRSDIMEAIGNPELKSIEDLVEIFETVKARSEELGIDVVYNPHPSWPNALEEFFGITRTPYQDGEQVRNWRSNPAWEEYLLFMNEMYTKGILYKEYLSSRPEDYLQRNNSGKTFAATYNAGVSGDANGVFYEQGIEGHFEQVTELLTVGGENRFRAYDTSVGWSSCFLSADSDKLERLINYMEFLKSPEGDTLTQWGIEGKHYTLNGDGLLERTDYFQSKTSQELGIGPWYFQASGLCEGVSVSSSALPADNVDPVRTGFSQQTVDFLKWRKPLIERKPVLNFARADGDSDEYMIEVKLADEWNKRTASIISADSGEEAKVLYDELMDYMKSAGIDQLEAAMTANYQEALKRYE